LGVWELAFVAFSGLFFEFLTPSTLEGCNFLHFILFLTIFNAPYALIRGVQNLLGTKNNGTFSFNMVCLEHLNVQ
jgi:hypothetical protein